MAVSLSGAPLRKNGIEEAAAAFCTTHDIVIRPLGRGNINDTYLVDDGKIRFVLQRINRAVFPEPVKVAENTARVTAHIAGKKTAGPAAIAMVIPTREGGSFLRDRQGNIWRAQRFIGGSRVMEKVDNQVQAEAIGRCLADFHEMIADLPPESLHVVLPGFHDLPGYLSAFDQAVQRQNTAAEKGLDLCCEMAEMLRERAFFFEEARAAGLLRNTVVHGDPKVSNVLFAGDGDLALALIDLDTVGPGLVLQDIGDCLRSCSCTAGEDASFTEAAFDIDMAAAAVKGYLHRRGLEDFERNHLVDALLLITFELGVRFATDHLQGDRYFKVQRRGDNLERALVQFTLTEIIRRQEETIKKKFAGIR